MTSSQLQVINNRIDKALSDNRISVALAQLHSMAMASNASWQIKDEIKRIGESYGYLRDYALDGVDDPSRGDLLMRIRGDIAAIALSIMRSASIEESPRQYFSVLRYERLQDDSSISHILDVYAVNNNRINMALMGGVSQPTLSDGSPLIPAQEKLAQRLFNLIWVTYPLSIDDEDSIRKALSDDALPEYFKSLIISALMLGVMEYYDERKIVLLGETYLNATGRLEINSLCALLLCMWVQRECLVGNRIRAIVGSVCEKPGWRSDLKMVFMHLVRTRDTDRISLTMTDEIIPQMMKLRPGLYKKLSDIEHIEDLVADENPEWTELFEKSGVADKLKELTELQADGGDVMMSTFSHLKTFAFFNDIANWFLPFYPENTAVVHALGSPTTEIGEIINATPMLCDSDKYSIILSLEQLPASNRRMMLEQFKIQDINLAELRNSEINHDAMSRENVANRYIQDIYRFFKLYRRKGEFPNPFTAPINLASVSLLSSEFDDMTTLSAVAEFYFRREYYAEANELYNLILRRSEPTAQLYQKIGYCRQQQGDISGALDMYLRSELSTPYSIWTLRRIAQCYKLLDNPNKALEYYMRISKSLPNDVGLALNIGHCYLAIGDYESALKQYYKVDFLTPDSGKSLRPIAWCTYILGDFERSAAYYERVMNSNPTPNDYFNLGHLCMAMKKYKEAKVNYLRYMKDGGHDVDSFEKALKADREFLLMTGVDSLMIDIVADSVSADFT